jgi:hypothetical protein
MNARFDIMTAAAVVLLATSAAAQTMAIPLMPDR